jgi:acyl carrier protein
VESTATSKRVRRVAADLGVVTREGSLKQLDSLGIIDMVSRLERTFSIRIPPEAITSERFASINSIAALVEELSA